DALTAQGVPRRDDVLRAAVWRLESGGSADPATLVAGARRARAMFDHRLAERLARAAVDEGGGTDAWVTLADALYWQGRYDEARVVVLQHSPLDALPDVGVAVVVAWARVASSVFFWGLGDADRAEEIMRSAERAMPPGPDHDLLVAHRATLAFFHGRPQDAVAAAEALLTRGSASDEITVAVRIAAVPALAVLGRCSAALRLADEGIQAGMRLMDERPQFVDELLAMQAVACWTAGRYRQMEDLASTAYQRVVAEKAHDLRGLWAMLLGRAALAAGQAATARHRLREACALLRQHDPGGLLPWALGGAALAAALLGNVEDAQQALAEQRRSQAPAVRIFEWDAVLAQAWTAAARGELSAARRLACRAADLAAARGLRCAELEALHDAVRLGTMQVVPRLTELAGTVDSVLAPVFAGHAAALARGDGDALDGCAARFAELGAVLLLGSMLTIGGLEAPGVTGWLLVPALLLAIRPASVWLAMRGCPIPAGERAFVAWFGVRGVGSLYYAAIAVGSGVLASGEQRVVVWTAIAAVVVSILVHGASASALSRRWLAVGDG
ncbi:MAG: cation:proton antiporter, partial [Thermoleophilaceae bacterium]